MAMVAQETSLPSVEATLAAAKSNNADDSTSSAEMMDKSEFTPSTAPLTRRSDTPPTDSSEDDDEKKLPAASTPRRVEFDEDVIKADRKKSKKAKKEAKKAAKKVVKEAKKAKKNGTDLSVGSEPSIYDMVLPDDGISPAFPVRRGTAPPVAVASVPAPVQNQMEQSDFEKPPISLTVPPDDSTRALFIQYLLSHGADPASAALIASQFFQQQDKYLNFGTSVEEVSQVTMDATLETFPAFSHFEMQLKALQAQHQAAPVIYQYSEARAPAYGPSESLATPYRASSPAPTLQASGGGAPIPFAFQQNEKGALVVPAPPPGVHWDPSMIWQRSYRPGAVEMEGRAYGAPERPEQAFLSETSSLAAPATANPHDSNRNTTLDDIEEAPEEAHSTRSDHVSYEAETAEATPVYKIELIADKPVDLDAHHWGGDVISAEALNFYDFVKSSPKWRRRIIVVILLSVAAVIASVVATTQAAQGAETVIQTGAPSVAPSSMPSFITEGILEAAEGLVRGEITPGTPQYDAVGWLSTIDGTSESLPNFKQRFVLVVFYFATGGDSWTNRADWLNPDLHECDWGTEVSCEEDPAGGRKVTILDDVRNNLRGSIPRELALLTNLETLILESNRLTGSLPEELFELTTLVTVNVARNQLTGRIPPNIGNDDNLATLDLHENMIGSSLPSSLFGLPLLTVLDLSKNVMTGTLSGGISELRTLKKLDLSNNRMSGRLPATVGNNVDIIHLDFNNFTGLIGTMMSPGQLEFTVAHNELTGTLPATLSVRNLTNLPSYRLQTVDLSHNFFEGRIPNNAGLISSLRTFDISSNELSGPIPSGENHWLNLEVFGASNNNLQGTVPFSISRRLSFLDLSNNDFRGGIPDDFEQHPTLEIFILHDNPNLGGTIPSFTDVSRDRLRDLDIESCGLTGTIPRSMYVLENLEIFKASDNNLGGSIPTTLGELSVLNTFHVDSNLLTGPIPDYFGDMFLLKSLHLANNDFRGMIPSSLAEVSTLASLTLSPGNPKLEGTIEQSTCDAVEENSGNSLGAELIGCTIQCECCSSRTQPEVCL